MRSRSSGESGPTGENRNVRDLDSSAPLPVLINEKTIENAKIRAIRERTSVSGWSRNCSKASNHTPFLAGFTTTTLELKFSVHTSHFSPRDAAPNAAR
jgi:hypothetical protein